jgi:NAD(P)-dependent dehydrogenase (short-subunit alcohol dehydrogenase family)
MSVWLITGASRGLGEAITRAALEAGHQVIAGARNTAAIAAPSGTGDSLFRVELDVTDSELVLEAVQAGVRRFGRVDVVVNNAGYGVLGAIEELSDEETRRLFDVNVFGTHRVLRCVLPVLRQQGSGRIINVGSSLGFAASASHGMYGATKAALEAITEALDVEVRPLGIRAMVVELGGFRTGYLSDASIQSAAVVIDQYTTAGGGRNREDILAFDGAQPGDPTKAAAAIVHLAQLDDPPFRVQLGRDSVDRVLNKLESVNRELENWRWLAESTEFEEDLEPGRHPNQDRR